MVIGPSTARLMITSQDSAGRASAIEFGLSPGFVGPPAHVHRRFDHVWYVLEGQIRVLVGETWSLLHAGASAFVPRGVAHSFENLGPQAARLLEVDVPAAIENYFRELARAFPAGALVDRAKIADIQRRHDTEPVV